MKKSRIFLLILVLAIIGAALWLLAGADPKNLQLQGVIVDVPDTFEK